MDAASGNAPILVFCDGGFANRINCLISGMALAELLGRGYLVLWPRNNRCGASFEDLFVPHCPALQARLQDLVPYEGTLNIWLHENDVGFSDPFLGLRALSNRDELIALAADGDRAILFAENAILPWLPPERVAAAINRLVFRPEIVARTRQVLGNHAPGGYFGIHLRGTDFLPPPPTDKMLEVVVANPNHAFYVCSDDADIERRFTRHANVFVHAKTAYVEKLTDGPWRRDVVDSDGLPYTSNIDRTAQSVIQACVDLLLLGASTPIRTSASSFLALAERLRESGLIIRLLTDATPPSTP